MNAAESVEERLRRLLAEGIEADRFPCGIAAVGGPEIERVTTAAGDRDPDHPAPCTEETRFDLASLTKPIVTTTVLVRLLEAGEITFDDTIGDHVPRLSGTERGEIPLSALLTHTSGLEPYVYNEAWGSREEVIDDLFERDLQIRPAGEAHEYSCLNFVHLEEVLRRATGEDLAALARKHVFDPAGMEGATMGPPADAPVAVTYDHEYADRRLEGETNDPIARAMGGYSANAGLFGTVGDVAAFAETLLRDGAGPDGDRLLSPASVRAIGVKRAQSSEIAQGYGWRTPIDGTPAPIWGEDAIGHTGYTGTSLWLDFEGRFYAVLFTNAVYEGVPNMERFRRRFHAMAAAAATGPLAGG